MIELSPKQCEYIQNATHRYNGKIGATQCGKTHVDISHMIPERVLERKGKKGLNLILGVTKETIERNVLEPMRDFWGQFVDGDISNYITEINNRNICTIFGEKVYCLGAEKVSQVAKMRGAKFKYAYIDEIVDIHREVFELLKSRLSLSYSVCDFTGNPSFPGHWVKKLIESDIDIYCQSWTIYDNKFLDADVIRNLEREYAGTVYFDRYILGKWMMAEGLIYPNFDPTPNGRHIVPTVDRPYEAYVITNDYGVQHACVFGLWGLYQGRWYLVKTYYHHGEKDGQRTVEDSYNALMELVGDRRIYKFYMDNAPIASSFNVHVRRKWAQGGLRQADNEVLAGIQDVSTVLNTGVVLFNDCNEQAIEEFGAYAWDSKSIGDERPIKENDDCMDMVRYFVRSMRLAKPER